ncbi:MAG: 4'-phosphopantetheinyl transferase superfamily protein [Vicinamibacterales bacterium]
MAAGVDIWAVDTGAVGPDQVVRMATWLTADEAARGRRYVRARDRDAFVVTRALVRTTLSRYGPTAPRDWRFVTNAHQCPFVIDAQAGAPPLRFNVSHTDGLVVLAVVRGHDVGVDVEAVSRQVLDEVPERYFAPAEVAALRALPAADQPRAFFDYWTLKEAYIKARGLGLAIPLDRFAFTLAADRAPAIAFADGFDDRAERWQFRQAWPTPTHRLALAVSRTGDDLPVTLRHLAAADLLP